MKEIAPKYLVVGQLQKREYGRSTNERDKPRRCRKTYQPCKKIAMEYRELTGRPLGITGEIAEYEAARLLNLCLSCARQAGYDATRADGTRVQIKGRVIFENSKPEQRIGRIRLDHDWDTVVLVLMNANFEPLKIYEATRSDVEAALTAPGSRARNERGALGISKFQSIATLVWSVR
jgi:hypothetical protein